MTAPHLTPGPGSGDPMNQSSAESRVSLHRVAVLGAGTMGRAIAAHLAGAGTEGDRTQTGWGASGGGMVYRIRGLPSKGIRTP